MIEWIKPTFGALCFGILMYISMLPSMGKQSPWLVGGFFVALALATAVVTFRAIKPYGMAAFAAYIFCVASFVYGVAFAMR
ncbi:hypothetical protein [Sphingobium chungangianum]